MEDPKPVLPWIDDLRVDDVGRAARETRKKGGQVSLGRAEAVESIAWRILGQAGTEQIEEGSVGDSAIRLVTGSLEDPHTPVLGLAPGFCHEARLADTGLSADQECLRTTTVKVLSEGVEFLCPTDNDRTQQGDHGSFGELR
jgi:hypothetical protein